MQKGFAVTPLMVLKSVANNEVSVVSCSNQITAHHQATLLDGRIQGVFSRQGSGMCFEFSPADSGTYIAGTEHGQLHKCSVSYSEQYLDTFTGHKAPVNRLLFSPYWHVVFAT